MLSENGYSAIVVVQIQSLHILMEKINVSELMAEWGVVLYHERVEKLQCVILDIIKLCLVEVIIPLIILTINDVF